MRKINKFITHTHRGKNLRVLVERGRPMIFELLIGKLNCYKTKDEVSKTMIVMVLE